MLALINRLKSDEALMLAYQRGDTGAFERLYHRHKDGLFAFLYRSCPRRPVVEDLAQETWMAVVNSAAGYQPEASFRTWLYRIGHHRLADYWRRRDNRHLDLDSAPEQTTANSDNSADDLRQRLLGAIGELPGEQRDALLLREQGFSLAEIGEITDSGEETVKSRLRYARRQLREQLGDEI